MQRIITSMRVTQNLASSFFIALFLFLPCASALAESTDLTIAPVVIDEKAKARDILKQSITIVNTSDRKLNLYPSVNDVSSEEGEQEFVRAQNSEERETSLANWIELSRGVLELGPGEEKTIPFVIRVNMNAASDTYHAYISLYEGSTRETAEAGEALGRIAVNVEVQSDIKEFLQLNKFFTENIFFSGDDVLFNYQLENIGNQNLQPRGEIRIYDRKGKEVASVAVNKEGKNISPDELSQLASVWTAASGLGKYKAFINIDYGSQRASVQDTVFFWIVPWQQLLGLSVVSLLAVIFLALYFHRWFDTRYHSHFAYAGGAASSVASRAMPLPSESGISGAPEKQRLRIFSLFSHVARNMVSLPRRVHPSLHSEQQTEQRAKSKLREALGDIGMHPGKVAGEGISKGSHAHIHGGTIDLTKIHNHESSIVSRPGHIINLKDQ